MNFVSDIQKCIKSLEWDSADDNNEEIVEEVKSDENEQKEVEIKGVRPPFSLPEEEDMNHLSRNKMDRKQQQQGQQKKAMPRLDQTIAKTCNNEYDGERGRDASTSFSSSSMEEEDYSSILKIRSLDIFPSCYANRTNFGIGGSDGGEIDRICSSLGLSRPEDFAISLSNWKDGEVVGDGGCGIKGVRPPLLAPPSSLSRPLLDNSGSTWDLIGSCWRK